MLVVSVEACSATGVHIYSGVVGGPASALHREHFPNIKLKPAWKTKCFSIWERISDVDIISVELTDGE